MALPDPLPDRYEHKTPIHLIAAFYLVGAGLGLGFAYIGTGLPPIWRILFAVGGIALALFIGWQPTVSLLRGRVALVVDAHGLEDHTPWGRVRRVPWSDIRAARFIPGRRPAVGIWLDDDAEWLLAAAGGRREPGNAWSLHDFAVDQAQTMLDNDDMARLFQHYGGVRIT